MVLGGPAQGPDGEWYAGGLRGWPAFLTTGRYEGAEAPGWRAARTERAWGNPDRQAERIGGRSRVVVRNAG
jgi:hypothetical protein